MIEPLIRFLNARDDLSDPEIAALRDVPCTPRAFNRGAEIVPAHSFPETACLLVVGIAGRELARRDGGRQFSAIHFAGEVCDAAAIVKRQVDHAIVAITPVEVVFLPHGQLRHVLDAFPHLTRLFWLAVAIDASIQRGWIAAMGRGSATEKLAHLLCEIYLRLELIGLARDHAFPLAITQAELADCIGVSVVQANRSLRDLRERGLATMRQGTVEIEDWQRLVGFAQFDARYLNLVKTPR